MEEKEKSNVPYIVYEGSQVRFERLIRRLIFALILAAMLIFASNALWLWAWTQYDYESSEETITTSYMQDGRGLNIIGTGNEVVNGSGSDYRDQETKEAETEEEWEEQRDP